MLDLEAQVLLVFVSIEVGFEDDGLGSVFQRCLGWFPAEADNVCIPKDGTRKVLLHPLLAGRVRGVARAEFAIVTDGLQELPILKKPIT